VYLRPAGARRQYFVVATSRQEGPLEHVCCLRCNREFQAGQKAVAVYMFAQTVIATMSQASIVGIKPKQESVAQRIFFCPPCSVSLATGLPPDGALNVAAWKMIRDLVGSDAALSQAALETLRGIVGLLPASETDVGSAVQPAIEANTDSAVQAAWETLRGIVGLQPANQANAGPAVQ
jgi:hypothetical protein